VSEIRSFGDITRVHARARADGVALHFQGRETTYRELDERASRVANGLIALGLKPGARVALLAKNTDLFFELHQGCAKADVVLVPVNFRLAAPEVVYVVNDAQAELFVVGPDFHALVAGVAPQLRTVKRCLSLGPHAEWPDFAAWRDAQSAADPQLVVSPSAVTMQMYTSGTTGRPKGAQLTHGSFLALFETASRDWGRWSADDVLLVAMPLFHVAGGEWGQLGLYVGAKSVVMPEVDPGAILHAIAEQRVTKSLFVPAVLLFLVQHPDCAKTDFSSLDVIYYGASPIPLDLQKRAAAAFGCGFAQLYGATETTGAITYLAPAEHRGERMKSCGKAIASAELRVVRPDGADCAPGEVGEVICRSAQNMVGYWNLAEANARTIRGDWLHTGDAGWLDADGYLYIHDRMKDMIVSGGENVYPAEVESAIFGCPGVADVAVIGVPDEQWGEAVKAVVVRAPGSQVTGDEIVAYARERIAGYKLPKSVDFLDALPRNPSGKILKRELRRPYWEGRERQVN
jgi:acyl-CoA synthetase (AMP-forming)/AMP-acid ligase II